MYLQKLDDGSYRVTSHPDWYNKDGLVSEDYLLSNGFYKLIENKLTPISREKNISDWIIDEKNKTAKVIYNEPTDLELLNYYKNSKLSEIDQTYNQYILNLYPIEKQLKMTMHYNSLLNKQVNSQLTELEQSEKSTLESLHTWYKNILAKHQSDKTYILNETDVEKIKNYVVVPE